MVLSSLNKAIEIEVSTKDRVTDTKGKSASDVSLGSLAAHGVFSSQ